MATGMKTKTFVMERPFDRENPVLTFEIRPTVLQHPLAQFATVTYQICHEAAFGILYEWNARSNTNVGTGNIATTDFTVHAQQTALPFTYTAHQYHGMTSLTFAEVIDDKECDRFMLFPDGRYILLSSYSNELLRGLECVIVQYCLDQVYSRFLTRHQSATAAYQYQGTVPLVVAMPDNTLGMTQIAYTNLPKCAVIFPMQRDNTIQYYTMSNGRAVLRTRKVKGVDIRTGSQHSSTFNMDLQRPTVG